jgi:SAM-dependent methyltransferase
MREAHKAEVQARFGRTAEAYVRSAGHAGGPDLERILNWAQAIGPRRALDIATGGGHTALALAGVAANVVATDLTEPMLRAARAFIAARSASVVRFAACDVEALPFTDASFDVVTCRIAAHHFPSLLPALMEVARVLRPAGSFLVQDILGHDDADLGAFILEVEKRRDPSHVRSFRRSEWLACLRAAGLTVVEEALVEKVRVWDDWTGRTEMTAEAKAGLERYVLGAPAACREAFRFEVAGERVLSFADRMILFRADRR